MSPLLRIALAGVLFASLGYVVRRQGGRALIAFAVLWIALVSLGDSVSLPSAGLPVHDFERSLLPGLAEEIRFRDPA